MKPIKDINGLPPEIKKLQKGGSVRRAEGQKSTKKAESEKSVSAPKDRAEISQIGRELLQLKQILPEYSSDVEDTRLLTESEIREIKEKIKAKYYFSPEIAEKVIAELLNLPNFTEDI